MRNINSAEDIFFYDHHPKPADFFHEVIDGMRKDQKYIPPKFFYNEEGSRLFDAICHTTEYYPTRTEKKILRNNADEIARCIGENCLLVEPGSGNSEKVRLLLEDLRPHAYMPIDISKEHLKKSARKLSDEFPWLDVHAACIDFTDVMSLPYKPANVRKVAFFPGSSIGNFEPDHAVDFLHNVRKMVGKDGGLLIGVDLKKSPRILNAAYNDALGITAAFNLNLLKRINQELDADFNLGTFAHKAFYHEQRGRIEMHLESRCDQTVTIDGEEFGFQAGETIHTENSYKYTSEEFGYLAETAGFRRKGLWTDEDDLFSVHYFVSE